MPATPKEVTNTGRPSPPPKGNQNMNDDTTTAWAAHLMDPCALYGSEWRAAVDPSSRLVGTFVSIVAAALDPNDPWNKLGSAQADDFDAWWGDILDRPTNLEPVFEPLSNIGSLLAPVPNVESARIIDWATKQGDEGYAIPFATTIDAVEHALKCLAARFREVEPGIELREFFYGSVTAAVGLVRFRELMPHA